MTNHWNDIANSDCVLIVGCNPAENHPISFKYITQVQDKGGKLIVVDPRFTRSGCQGRPVCAPKTGNRCCPFCRPY